MEKISLNMGGCNPPSCCISGVAIDPATNILTITENVSDGDENQWTVDLSALMTAMGQECCLTAAEIDANGALLLTNTIDGVATPLPPIVLPSCCIDTAVLDANGDLVITQNIDGVLTPLAPVALPNECCLTAAEIDANGDLLLTNTINGVVTPLPAIALPSGSDCCLTSAVLDVNNQLVLTNTINGTATSLPPIQIPTCCIESAVLDGNGDLVITQNINGTLTALPTIPIPQECCVSSIAIDANGALVLTQLIEGVSSPLPPLPLPSGATSAFVQTVTAGNEIGTHSPDGVAAATSIFETVTALSIAPNGTDLVYTPENGVAITIPGAISSETNTTLTLSGSTLTYTGEDGTPVNIVLPTGATSVVTQTETAGNEIATHSPDGVAAATSIFESVTSLVVATNGTDLEFLNEAGTTNIISGAISGPPIQYGNGAPVNGTTPSDPPLYVDNTDILNPVYYYNLQPQNTWHMVGGSAACDWMPSIIDEYTTGTADAYVTPINDCQSPADGVVPNKTYAFMPHIINNANPDLNLGGTNAQLLLADLTTMPAGILQPNLWAYAFYTGASPLLATNPINKWILQASIS